MRQFFTKLPFIAFALLGIGAIASTTQAAQNFAQYVAQNYYSHSLQYIATGTDGEILTGQGALSSLGMATSSVVNTGAGRVAKVIVTTAGSTPGGIYDSATVASAVPSTLIATLPNTVGVIDLNFPTVRGVTVIVGASQVVSTSFN